jgi:hypothetical protein
MKNGIRKWWQVYSGDEEKRFFVALSRHNEYIWRSTDKISQESGLTKIKVETIIAKYHKAGMVMQHPKDPEKWGYWERVAANADKKKDLTVSETDKKKRLDKADKTKQ